MKPNRIIEWTALTLAVVLSTVFSIALYISYPPIRNSPGNIVTLFFAAMFMFVLSYLVFWGMCHCIWEICCKLADRDYDKFHKQK